MSKPSGATYVCDNKSLAAGGAGKDGWDLSMQIRDKIIHIESIIDFQLGKFDKKSKELTSNIIYPRNNDRTFTE